MAERHAMHCLKNKYDKFKRVMRLWTVDPIISVNYYTCYYYTCTKQDKFDKTFQFRSENAISLMLHKVIVIFEFHCNSSC